MPLFRGIFSKLEIFDAEERLRRFEFDCADLVFGNFPDGIQRRVGQLVNRCFRKMEVHKNGALRTFSGDMGFGFQGAAS